MSWPVRALLGPLLWAAAFSGVYALHGLGCALGWPGQSTPVGPLHSVVLIGVWLCALMAAGLILWTSLAGLGREARIARLGGWIGLVATGLTLFPVLGVSSCG